MIDRKYVRHLTEKYQPADVTGDGKPETFCNFFVNDVALKMGCYDFVKDQWPMLANEMVAYMEKTPQSWQELDCDEAQREANFGHLVVAGAPGKPHGHVALIIQGSLTWSKQFSDDVPNCANVGTKNFYGKPASYAFPRTMKPRYWKWLGKEAV